MGDTLAFSIRERYLRILDQIAEAVYHAHRETGEVRLVVVTKSQPLEVVREAIETGAGILGENYAEEAVAKITAITDKSVEWHMIGHVQSRKADLVARNFSLVHSLDSIKLAGQLNRSCEEAGRILPVLLEINVSGEESKFGFPGWDEYKWAELTPHIEKINTFSHLRVQGLMTMPPLYQDPEQTRSYFQRLWRLGEFLKERFPRINWKELSMGTSVDFVAAINEGATFVRIGQAILGPRPG